MIARRIARGWPLDQQIAFFERELELPLMEEVESAKLFPASQSAREVRDKLVGLARRRGVRFVSNSVVTNVSPRDGGWDVHCSGCPPLNADAVVLATGGLSVPATGSDGHGLAIARQLGQIDVP